MVDARSSTDALEFVAYIDIAVNWAALRATANPPSTATRDRKSVV